MRIGRLVGLMATTSLLLAAVLTPAQAASEARYFEPPEPYHNKGTFDPGCDGLDLVVAYDYEGVYSTRIVPGTNRQAFLFKDDFSFTERWIDDATGEVLLRMKGAYVAQETSATKVPLSKVPAEYVPPEGLVGPVYRFQFQEVGWDKVFTGDWRLLHFTGGTVRLESLFDTLGDRRPGGTFLHDEIVEVTGSAPAARRRSLRRREGADDALTPGPPGGLRGPPDAPRPGDREGPPGRSGARGCYSLVISTTGTSGTADFADPVKVRWVSVPSPSASTSTISPAVSSP